jgi:hypothetical protein
MCTALLATYTLIYLSISHPAAGGREEAVWKNVVIPRRSKLALLEEGQIRKGGDLTRGSREEAGLPEVRGEVGQDFRIFEPFNFPQPAFSLPASVLLQSRWVTDLQNYLRTIQGRTVSVVTATIEHTDILLNWLIAAHVRIEDPLPNIMVISMDAKLHSILVSRGLNSLYVHKDMVVSPQVAVPRPFSQVHVVRLAVVRLMNHYGYDVINYDCDAIPLRNPQPLFDEYIDTDLIGTFGKGPHVLYEKWGVTLNTGVMVMRATANMGK